MCVKTVDTCHFLFDSVPDWYKTQEICDKAFYKDTCLIKYCLDRCNSQEMSDKPVDAFLSTLKFASDRSVASEMIKKRDDDLFSNDNIIFVNEDSNYVLFFSDKNGYS